MLVGAFVVAFAAAVAGCSGSSTGAASSSPAATSATPLSSPTGGSTVLPPIFISKAEDITVKVGDTLYVTTPNVSKVTTGDRRILDVSQAHSDGSATYAPGAKVIGPGATTFSVYGGITNSVMYVVNVTAK